MRYSMVFLALFFVFGAKAQNDSLPAPYKRFPTIPPFDLLQKDSTRLTKDKIQKKRNTLLMYFSPDCSHCQHQTEELLSALTADTLKDVQIIMATYQPFEDMVAFYKKYQVAQYPNIKMGRDEKFFLPPFYRMQNLPYLALYDKKGNLITTFEGSQKIITLVDAFNVKTDN
jgi:thioredoxin-related protein